MVWLPALKIKIPRPLMTQQYNINFEYFIKRFSCKGKFLIGYEGEQRFITKVGQGIWGQTSLREF